MSNNITLYNIQALRAIASIMVVFHHGFQYYQTMHGDLVWVKFISDWGFVGVDIFFVLSGFIIAYTTLNKPRGLQSAKTFLRHRLSRIYLGYWPFFIAMCLIHIAKHDIDSFDILGSFLLYNSNMFQLLLPVSWSLTYEIYFYLLFLVTFLFTKKQLYIYIPLFILLLFIVILSSFYQAFLPPSFFYSPFLLEFFMGVLLYMFRRYFMHNWVLILATILMVISFYFGVVYESKNGLIRIVTFGTSAFFLVLISLILEYKQFYQSKGFLVSLGDASFTLYLSHTILLNIFYYSGMSSLFNSDNAMLPLLGLMCIVLICIGFSLLYFKYIEYPIYQKSISKPSFFR